MNVKFLIISLLLLPLFGFSQNIKAGLLAGFNATQVDGDDLGRYNKLGVNVGATALMPLSEQFFIGFELTYTRKGAKIGAFERETSGTLTDLRKLRLDYVEVPLLLYYYDLDKIRFGAGAAYGRLVNYERYNDNGKVDKESAPPVEDRDISFLADGAFFITENIGLNFRFSYSILPIAQWEESNHPKKYVFNNVLTLRGMYIF